MRLARLLYLMLLSVCFFVGGHLYAQSVDTAGLEVDVQDPSGAHLPGATLTLTQTQTHDVRVGVSDTHGRFRFTALPVGSYELSVAANGFATYQQNGVTLEVGQASTLSVGMKVANSDTVVQVTSDVSTIDPDRTTIGQTIGTEEIDNLPSDGRNFLDFAVTVPNVTVTQTTGQNSGFSVNGQRSRSNSIMIDGVENNGQLNGNVRQTLSQDAIGQFQVLTEQFPAEFGGAGGGFINVVTRAGSDRFHGSAYYFMRNQWMNTPNYFTSVDPGTYARNDVGMHFAGPIKENRTYFYGALEYIGLNTSKVSRMAGYAATVDPVLQSGVYINAPTTHLDTDSYIPQSSAQTLSSLRIDHRFSDRDTFIARVIYVQYIQANNVNAGSYYDFSTATSTYTHTQNYFAEWTHIFTPTLLNEAHFMVAPQRLKQQANSSGTGADIGGSVYIGPTTDFPVTLDEDHYEADDAVSWTRHQHLIKMGVQVNYIRAHSVFPTAFQGYWNFYSTTNFASKVNGAYSPIPYKYTQSFGNPDIHLPDTLIGAYLEDSWKATARLTLNYGVRYDLDLQPQGLNQNVSDPMQQVLSSGMNRDYNNFSPRIGLAFSLDKRGKTILRAGYGMFYDKNLLILARNTLQTKETMILNLNNSTSNQIRAAFLVGPYQQSSSYPTSGYGSAIAPTISRAYPGLVLPMIHQVDFGVDRSLTSRLVLSVTGIHVEGEKLLKAANSNLLPPVILTKDNQTQFGFAAYDGTNSCNSVNSSLGKAQPCFQQYGRPYFANRKDPNFNDINITGPWGHSNYNALRVSLVQSSWKGFTMRAGYVWSKALDDAPDFLNGALPNNPYDPGAEKSLSNEDVRHRFTGAAVYRIPFRASRSHHDIMRQIFGNWIMSSTLDIHSGSPENITVGSDLNNDDSSTDRPFINGVMVGRNSFRTGRQSNWNARGQKEIRFARGQRLTFSAEVFNLTNHLSYTDYDTIWGTGQNPTQRSATSSPTTFYYGDPDTASGARSMQLGFRYTF
ncbi:MAG: TonB-dependent receptor [Acidobacteriaceae bacterium]|nr:TonB-dependent receptor [Acidobacteriaceae bacterium]